MKDVSQYNEKALYRSNVDIGTAKKMKSMTVYLIGAKTGTANKNENGT